MRYVLHAEAAVGLGTGHVMRLSAIAEEMISRNLEVIFVGDIGSIPWLENRILGLGFSRVLFNVGDFFSDPGLDILVFDSYTRDIDDCFISKLNWKKVVLISDVTTPRYSADLVIHPNISEGQLIDTGGDLYSGPKYIPLRKTIKKVNYSREVGSKLKILLVGGGTDPFNFVSSLALILSESGCSFEAFLFTHDISLALIDNRFSVVEIGPDLDVLAETADLVFTTASTTSLEFIAREMAVGIGCAVENQKNFYDGLKSSGAAAPIGKRVLNNWIFDAALIDKLISDVGLRTELRTKCKNFIDCDGSSRIVDLILNL
jgi:spore coat polysaccharide biosynthesis predicted glycosyltransferase SpsG